MTIRRVFIKKPQDGCAVYGGVFDCGGGRLENFYNFTFQSDAPGRAFLRYSEDNGKTWGAPREILSRSKTGDKILQHYYRGGYYDHASGKYISLRNEGIFDADFDADTCLRCLSLQYRVSSDHARTFSPYEPVIQKGPEFDAPHPLPGVWKGKNSVMLGDQGCRPLTRKDGAILVPCQISPVDENGEYVNPGNGYTYHYAAILIGKWNKRGMLDWELSEPVEGNPELTTRGLLEPTLAFLDNGDLLMVMRGCNAVMVSRHPEKCAPKTGVPGRKWFAVSKNGGKNWSTPAPWHFDDGESFISPGSCSQLLTHSSGKLLWFGNITSEAFGNNPRFPLLFGEVNKATGFLKKETLTVIDDRHEGESEKLILSNFLAVEDAATQDILIYMPRVAARKNEPVFNSDLYEYRIKNGEQVMK